MTNFCSEGMIIRGHAVRDKQQGAEVGVDAIQFAIEEVSRETIHVIDTLKIDSSCADVSQFRYPTMPDLALHVEEPSFGVLGLDVGIDDKASGPDARRTWRGIDASVLVQTGGELGIERHGNSVEYRL